jgi:hypothetical protein
MRGPSAWELVCQASLTGALQVNRHLRLSVSGRRVPVLTSPSGTQRAWPLLVRLRAGLRCRRRWVHLAGGSSGAFLAAIAARSNMRIRCAGKPGRHDIRNFRVSLPGAPMSTQHAFAFSSPVTSTAAARIFAPGTPAAASIPRRSPSVLFRRNWPRSPRTQLAGWPLSHACQSLVASIAGRDSDG